MSQGGSLFIETSEGEGVLELGQREMEAQKEVGGLEGVAAAMETLSCVQGEVYSNY